MIREKVIARRSCVAGQYKKGDTLEICQRGHFFDYNGKNLTRGGGAAFDWSDVKPVPRRKKEWIYFLGIPLFYTKKEDD